MNGKARTNKRTDRQTYTADSHEKRAYIFTYNNWENISNLLFVCMCVLHTQPKTHTYPYTETFTLLLKRWINCELRSGRAIV